MLRRTSLALVLAISMFAFGCGGNDGPVQLDTFGPDTVAPKDVSDPGTPGDEGRPDTTGEDPGTPPVDPGTPPVDPGTPPEDEGVPPEDVPPVEDEGLPPEDVPPVEDEGVPPEDVPESDTTEDTTVPEECEVDDDCIDFGIPSECNEFACEDGFCVEVPVLNDSPCSDGDLCTAPDTCQDGFCVSGPAVVCDDDDPCTVGTCEVTGCVYVPIDQTLTCGTGACYREVPYCTDGVPNTCVPGTPATETCDGVDNDCDGVIDNGNPGGGASCQSELSGPCKPGTTACIDGALTCVPNVLPQPEVCDGKDNDCDGVIDNGNPGGGEPCRTGKLGVCGVGLIYCVSGLLECVQTVQPSAEVCDGLDNNCDGQVDEGNPGAGLPCNTGLPGVCGEGISTCTEGKPGCIQVGQPSPEVCDGKDNDCDGIIDPPNSIGCSVFLKDQDGDGYGIAGDTQCLCQATAPYTGTQPGDCCDTDARARPSATAWFTTPNNCGSYDYNCDGQLSQQYTGTGACRFFDFPLNFCETTEGWVGGTPNCGVTGKYLTGCGLGFFVCNQQTSNIAQGCR